MIAATPDTTAQLVRIKHTLHAARSYLAKPDPASRVIAVILLDYVAESMLKTVYWSHPATAPKAKSYVQFPELLTKVADLTGDPPVLSLRLEIGNLHDQRNATQHRNVVPSIEDLSKNSAYVEAFLRQIFDHFFDADFDTLSMTRLISNEDFRTHLQSAQEHLLNGRYRQSVEESSVALEKATRWTAEAFGLTPLHYLHASWIGRDLSKYGLDDSASHLEQIVENINELTERIEEHFRLLATGADLEKYTRYKSVAPWYVGVLDTDRGEAYDIHHKHENYDEADAAVVFEHALDQVLGLQSLGAIRPQREDE